MRMSITTSNFRVLVLLIIYSYAQCAVASPVALVGQQIIDGVSDQVRSENVILVEGERILEIGTRKIIPAGAEVVELGNTTLMPGFIDCHSHPLIAGDDYQLEHLQRSSSYKALLAMRSLEGLLRAGWTTLRVMGDADIGHGVQDLRRAIDEGVFEGPRIVGASHYLSITGGGGDIRFMSPQQPIIADGLIVDGVAEARKAVRNEIKYGSDWIKVLVTGAFLSAGDNPRNVQFSPEELSVIVAEADRRGVPVAAHAHAVEGIRMAVEAGVRSIEHGTYLDDATIELMAEKGTFLVPTVYIGDYIVEEAADIREKETNQTYYDNDRPEFLARIGKAHESGVKVAVGVDFGGYGYDPAISVREMAVLVDAGLTPMQAIQAGTSVGAELLQLQDSIGRIEAGYRADIVAVPGNPLDDMSALQKVVFVMKNGSIIHRPDQ